MYVAAAYRAVWDRLPIPHPTAQARRGPRGSTAWKIGSFGGCADDDAVAAVIVSTRADEPFFRGDDPERSPCHTAGRFAWVRR